LQRGMNSNGDRNFSLSFIRSCPALIGAGVS
jgi:hypothetical protein